MIVNNKFKTIGEATDCAPLSFVKAIQEREPIHQHCSAEDMQQRFSAYFESLERFEYTVKDDDGDLLAIMVVTADFDLHLGQLCLVPTIAYATQPGLLFGAYRFLFSLARERGFKWICTSKTEDHRITIDYKKVK